MQANNIFSIGVAKTGVTIDPIRELDSLAGEKQTALVRAKGFDAALAAFINKEQLQVF